MPPPSQQPLNIKADGSRELRLTIILLTIFLLLVFLGKSIDPPGAATIPLKIHPTQHIRQQEEKIDGGENVQDADAIVNEGDAKLNAALGGNSGNEKNRKQSETSDDVGDAQANQKPDQQEEHQRRYDAGEVIPGKFTIVMLTYKAPKSLTTAIRSFIDRGLITHKDLHEVLIYFQSFEGDSDRKLVKSITKDAVGEDFPPFTVIGDQRNLPVAQATFAAIRQVKTEFVLYLECDRPIYPFPKLQSKQEVEAHVHSSMSEAIEFVHSGKADVFRLQLYAGPTIVEKGILPTNIYGTDAHTHCLTSPTYHEGANNVCTTAKKKFGNVFNTAYCKHWRKFRFDKPQKDLCDSFCFMDWSLLQDPAAFPTIDQQYVKRYINGVEIGNKHLLAHPNGNRDEESLRHNTSVTMCMTSGECNWTNQPTLYKKSWFLGAIATPCEANPKKCLGSPGRMSAVRQEQFFVKNDRHWKMVKHKVCLSQGLFYHFEVDNRERE